PDADVQYASTAREAAACVAGDGRLTFVRPPRVGALAAATDLRGRGRRFRAAKRKRTKPIAPRSGAGAQAAKRGEETARAAKGGSRKKNWAATYSPGGLRPEYHRRERA